MAVLGFCFLAVNPGGFDGDPGVQLREAVTGNYRDYYPLLHTLIAFRLPLMLTGGWFSSVILFQILLPLVKPTLVVIIMFAVIGQWNSWYPASIYLPRVRDKWPLQLIMRSLLIQNDVSKLLTTSSGDANHVINMTGNLVKYCVTVVGTLPILVAYPFAQRYFVTGITLGGVKG